MFYTFNASDTTAIIGYTSGIVTDFMPLIMIILGITLGLLIVRKIFKL